MRQAVVVGGGIAGAAISRELAKAGFCVRLLERGSQLCGGATWHAAGLVTRFGGSAKLKKLHVRSLEMLREVHERTEGGVGLHDEAGSIRLVKVGDEDRVLEAKHHFELAKLYDDPAFPTTLVTPSEIKALHPLVNAESLELGLRTTKDGDVDPTLLTNAIAKEAKSYGAIVSLNATVLKVEKKKQEGGSFLVEIAEKNHEEVVEADVVVNACGLWSQQLSAQLGLLDTHPAFVIEHHYAVTEPIPLLAEMRRRGDRVPVLRDLAGSTYLRQEQDGILMGPYEALPGEAVHDEWGRKGPPMTWAWELFPDKLDRLEDVLEHVVFETMPALQQVGFASVVNGPTIWAPDSLPRCGRTRIPGYYDFNTLTYGIAHSLPLAEYLRSVVVDEEQPYDLARECDPLRFGPWATDGFTKEKVIETYSMNNAPAYGAFENRKAGWCESTQRSPLALALEARGAVLGFSQGVETALVFDKKGVVQKEAKFHDHDWADLAKKEAENVRKSVGLGAATGFSKILLTGDKARELLMTSTTNVVPKTPGACRLTYAVAPKSGAVVAEFTATNVTGFAAETSLFKEEEDHQEAFYLIGPRDYAGHDVEWLRTRARALFGGGNEEGKEDDAKQGKRKSVSLRDVSDSVEILLLAGPDAKSTLLSFVEDTEERALVECLKFLKFATKPVTVCGVPGVTVARVSFTGEAGYELHLDADRAATLFSKIADAGVLPFGAYATNSLRLEKGFKVKGDIDFARYDEAGVDAFFRKSWTPPPLLEDAPPTKKKASLFEVSMPAGFEWSVPSDCPVLDESGQVKGYTTTSAYGTEAGATLAAGYLDSNVNDDDRLTLECFGEQRPLKVLEKPPAPVRGLDEQIKTTTTTETTTTTTPQAGLHPAGRVQQQQQQLRSLSTSTHSSSSSELMLSPSASLSEAVPPTMFPQHVTPISPWMREEYFRDTVRKPFEEASCFGGAMYADEDVHVDERKAIFKKEWVCVGHVSDVGRPGDVMPFELAGLPLFAANHKGTIKAFHNVCRHRGAKLVDTKLSGRAVVSCPYHKWGYALDGRLVGTPCWDEVIPAGSTDKQIPASLRKKFDHVSKSFKREDYGLFECDVRTFGNMLFARLVNKEEDQQQEVLSLDEHLGDLKLQLRNYPLDETVVARRVTLENVESNWKILAENFSEYYHLPAVHPELCTVSGVDEHVRTQGKGKYLAFATAPLTNGGTSVDPSVAPPMPGLEGTPDATAARHVLIFPNVFMSIYPNHVFRVIIEPQKAGKSRERCHLLVHPKIYDDLGPDNAETVIDNFLAFHSKVNTEDFTICEAVQRGMASTPYTGGRLSFRFEETIYRFQNLVADSLVGKGQRVPPADADFDPLNDLA